MPKNLSGKNEDALLFEKILNPETKLCIETILDVTNEKSSLSGTRSLDSLISLLGERPARFLINIIDSVDTTFISEIEGISSETKEYYYFIFGKYGYRLRGILSGKILKNSDSWLNIRQISTNYDLDLNDLFIKLVLFKNNNESMILEESAGGLLDLCCIIIDFVLDSYKQAMEMPIEVGVLKEEVEQSKERLEEAFAKITVNKKVK